MKKVESLILMFVLATAVFSCSKKSDPNANNTTITINGEVSTIVEINNSTLRIKVTDASFGDEVNTTYTKIQ